MWGCTEYSFFQQYLHTRPKINYNEVKKYNEYSTNRLK